MPVIDSSPGFCIPQSHLQVSCLLYILYDLLEQGTCRIQFIVSRLEMLYFGSVKLELQRGNFVCVLEYLAFCWVGQCNKYD
jgi:hypothetical protein